MDTKTALPTFGNKYFILEGKKLLIDIVTIALR